MDGRGSGQGDAFGGVVQLHQAFDARLCGVGGALPKEVCQGVAGRLQAGIAGVEVVDHPEIAAGIQRAGICQAVFQVRQGHCPGGLQGMAEKRAVRLRIERRPVDFVQGEGLVPNQQQAFVGVVAGGDLRRVFEQRSGIEAQFAQVGGDLPADHITHHGISRAGLNGQEDLLAQEDDGFETLEIGDMVFDALADQRDGDGLQGQRALPIDIIQDRLARQGKQGAIGCICHARGILRQQDQVVAVPGQPGDFGRAARQGAGDGQGGHGVFWLAAGGRRASLGAAAFEEIKKHEAGNRDE